MRVPVPRLGSILCVSLLALSWASASLDAQAPATRKPAAPQTRPRTPQTPTAKPAAKPPEPAKPPAPPPPQDVRFKTNYITGDQKTETMTLVKGERERFEFQDMVLLKQHDQKRVIQISRVANTYLVAPEGMPPMPAPAAAPAAPPKPPGVVMVATTIVDTGERKMAFGQQARHVKSMIDKQPMPGACDTAKQRIETDGWYIDTPKVLDAQAVASAQTPPAAPAGGCNDTIQATHNGDPKALGFPIGYTTTIIGEDGKPSSVSMEVSEFELTTLDPALFEIPQGLNAALNVGELGKALNNANEAKLAAENAAPPGVPVARAPGVTRIGVPELTNKTTQTVDTRALRGELVDNLTEAKFEVVPLAAATQPELQKRAAERGLDYLLVAEVTELKVSKSGGLGGIVRAASKVAAPAATAGAPQKEATEASVALKLIQPDGKQRLSTTAKGKDGGGLSAAAGIGLAKFAGGMAMGMMMGPQMMSRMYRFSALTGTDLQGMGLLGSPDLFRLQTMGMGMGLGLGRGVGIDQTAGAASYLMQQAMAMNSAASAAPAGTVSFDGSLGEALDNASKAIVKALEKK